MILSVVVRQFCEDNLDNIRVIGDTLYANCPSCGKSRQHFNVSLKTGLFHCYKCGWSGSFYSLGRFLQGPDFKYKAVMEEYGSEITFEMLEAIYSKEEPVLEIPDWTVNTVDLTGKSFRVRKALKYLKSRGIDQDEAVRYQMRLGLSGKYEDCIVIPVIEDGEVKNFVARRFRGRGKRYEGPSNCEGYVKKSHLLWGLDDLKDRCYMLILVEGIFDAFALKKCGYSAAALLGKQISATQIRKVAQLASKGVKSVVVLLDGGCKDDAVGIAYGLEGFLPDVRVAEMEGDCDPSENSIRARRAIEDCKSIDCY